MSLKVPTRFRNKKSVLFKKRSIIEYSGNRSNRVYYVVKGLLRSYHLDDKGKIHTFMFAPEDWIIGDVESIALGNQNSLYIDCLENSEVIVTQEINSDSNPTILEEKNNKLLRRVGMLQQRVIMLMSYSARERYEFFLKTYPTLPNRVSQKMIASYLGITPEALSKIRREMVSNR
jgi:CRP-like cAMP-binding protein